MLAKSSPVELNRASNPNSAGLNSLVNTGEIKTGTICATRELDVILITLFPKSDLILFLSLFRDINQIYFTYEIMFFLLLVKLH